MKTVQRCSVRLATFPAILQLAACAGFAAELPVPRGPLKPPPIFSREQLERLPAASEKVEIPADSELITERYPNRSVKIQRAVKQDAERNYVNHGPWTMWDERGQMVANGEFVEGERNGQWMRVLASFPGGEAEFQGPFTSQATFDQGVIQGTWTVVDAQNRLVGSWEFDRGDLHGAATIWYPNGQQRQEMRFTRGQPEGEAIAWKQDGTIWARDYYREGKQLVPIVSWHDQQQKESEGWVERSSFEIAANIDWWNGTIEITRTEAPGEDVRVGKWTEWYANGAVRYLGSFDQGQPTGTHSWWHENGQRMLSGEYDDGQRNGRWTRWHANGHKQEEGTYLAGSREGVWTAWSETGEIIDVQQLTATPEGADEDSPLSVISLDAGD